MAWTHWRRLLTPTWLLIGATLSAFDCELGVGPVGQGPAETNPPPPRPPRPPRGLAIEVTVRPNLSVSFGEALGTIREGNYVDSLRYIYPIGPYGLGVVLGAGEGRPGTYDVTVAPLRLRDLLIELVLNRLSQEVLACSPRGYTPCLGDPR